MDLERAIDVHGLDVQAQKLLMVLEQSPTVKEVVPKVQAAAATAKPVHKREQRPSSCLPGMGVLIEFCTDDNARLLKVMMMSLLFV